MLKQGACQLPVSYHNQSECPISIASSRRDAGRRIEQKTVSGRMRPRHMAACGHMAEYGEGERGRIG